MADSSRRSSIEPVESSDADPAGESARADVSFTYHRSSDGDQVVLGLETEGVHLSVAFDEGTSRATIDDALEAQRRELDHYYERTSTSR